MSEGRSQLQNRAKEGKGGVVTIASSPIPLSPLYPVNQASGAKGERSSKIIYSSILVFFQMHQRSIYLDLYLYPQDLV